MADLDQQIKYTIVIDKQTGAVKSVASDLEDVEKKAKHVGDAAKKTGEGGEDAFKKIGHEVTRMAAQLFIAKIALDEMKKLAEKNDAFQELQTIFEKTAKTLIETFQPAITMISKGLSGLLVVIGAAGKAIMEIAHGNFAKAADIMANSIMDANDVVSGNVKIMTANLAAAATARLEQEQTHAAAVAAFRVADADRRMQELNLTEDQKLALIAEKQQAELEGLNKAGAAKEQLLKIQMETDAITEKEYHQKLLIMRQQAADATKAINLRSQTEAEAVARQKKEHLQQFFQQEIQAGAAAAQQKYLQTHDTAAAVRAGAAAEVEGLAQAAGSYIMTRGAMAAADAFQKTSAATPGPVGIAAGAAAAAGVLAFYTGLAAAVGVVGSVAAGAISGGDGGASAAGGSGSGGGSGAGPGSGGGGFASAPAGATEPGMGGGGGVPGGGVFVTVYLDGDVLFRAISNASRDGRVVIAARSVVP